MKTVNTRSRVMIGGLILAGAVWAVDSFTGGGPTEVQAGQRATQEPGRPAVDWGEADALIDDLTRWTYSSVAPELDTLERDLFAAKPSPNAGSQSEPRTPPADVLAGGKDIEAESAIDFSARHVLGGVATGANPLAVIDDQVMHIDSDLENYTLIEIHRDFVVFQQRGTSRQVRLSLSPAQKN